MGILEWIQKYRCADPAVYPAIYPAGYDELVLEGHYISGGWRLVLVVLGVVLLIPKKTRKSGFTALFALIIGSVITNLVLKTAVARIRPYDAVEGWFPW